MGSRGFHSRVVFLVSSFARTCAIGAMLSDDLGRITELEAKILENNRGKIKKSLKQLFNI